MPGNMNCAGRFIRLVYTDDEVGGAYPTGTILHENVQARIDENLADVRLIQQGLETVKTFSATFWGYQLSFREQDEFEITSPPNHRYFGKRFRVVSQTEDSRHPAIKQRIHFAVLVRSQLAHGEVYQ